MSLPNRKILEEQYESDRRLYELVLHDMTKRIQTLLEGAGLHPGIKSRVKNFKSWFDKLLKKIRHGVSPDSVQIHDVLGIRIVCPFLEDIKKIEELINSHFEVIEQERKGALQSFKEFGYDSTHFLIRIPDEVTTSLALANPPPVEIQVRTILQDAWAEVEHELVYKSQFLPFDQPLKRKMAALNANLTLSDIIFQEIREYQRQLNRELEKRRSHFFERLNNPMPAEIELPPLRNSEDHYPHIENIDQALLEALTAHNQKNFKRAINYYSAILRLGPQPFIQALVLIHRGMAFFAEGLHENAQEDFDKAIELDAVNSKGYFYRAITKEAREEFESAVLDLNRSLELLPYQFDSHLARARCQLRLGHLQEAAADAEAALNLHPDDPQALEVMRKALARTNGSRTNGSRL